MEPFSVQRQVYHRWPCVPGPFRASRVYLLADELPHGDQHLLLLVQEFHDLGILLVNEIKNLVWGAARSAVPVPSTPWRLYIVISITDSGSRPPKYWFARAGAQFLP